jgi:BlaI family penicillinase repressor
MLVDSSAYMCNPKMDYSCKSGEKMSEQTKISDAEWEVMKVLWERSPLPSAEIVAALEKTHPWEPKTVKTLITRLVKKDAVGFNEDNRKYFYYPKVSKEECIKTEVNTFLGKFSSGMMKPLLTAFLDDENLSKKDLEELKRILEKKTGR